MGETPQIALLASTARRVRARYFFKKCLVGFIPSWPDERVAKDAAGNVIETHAQKGRVVRTLLDCCF
jgi:hypothetical protein